MSSPDELLLGSLDRFYREPGRLEVVRKVIERVDPGAMSLRSLDWLVTNYAKKRDRSVTYVTADGRVFDVHRAYKEQLASFSKKYFDPFRRGGDEARISYPPEGDGVGPSMDTTVGQLNFFRWAIRYGVIDYCAHHLEEIERDMKEASTKRVEPKRRRESKGITVSGKATMRFD